MDVEMYLWQVEDQGKAFRLFLNVDKSEMMSHSEAQLTLFGQLFQACSISMFPMLSCWEALQACIEGQSHQLKVMGERPPNA